MWTLNLVLFLFGAAVTFGANCPDGFEGHQGTCYFFSHGKETWIGAYETCKELFGARLVEVENDIENQYLSKRTISLGGDDFWIGLTDKMFEGEYVWETSKSILTGQGYWASGEPDNDPEDNCVKYSHSHSNQWSDSDCTHTSRYICEIVDGGGEIIG